MVNGEHTKPAAEPSVEQMFRDATIQRYAHGGGRVFWEGADGRRQLLMDLYGAEDGAIREYVLRMIAAAPDLLHALKNLYALVQGECPSLLEDDHHNLMVSEAIDKAEGRS